MAIFDIEKDDLLRMSDTQLEELIARLAEAEVSSHGHSPAYVSWSGSINAPDEGIDIHAQVPVDCLNTGFLERPDTILQAKKHSMPKRKITGEMITGKKLSETISEQAVKGGSYIIVSLADDCSPPMKKDRLNAMHSAVQNDPNSGNIHLDFYDRSKLAQWLRQHPTVVFWAKEILGQGYSGWQPYRAWSNPPRGVIDTLIFAPGVTISLPSESSQNLSIEDAIQPIRNLIKSTNKAVRITGLSGVGKTRIVQALFDETIGTDALDRTLAVYADTGAEPNPSATAMLDRLIAENRHAIMILDNCPPELHSTLASKVSATDREIKLITVEYDIRDDKPQTTEVIHIEAVGPEVSEQLLMRRFPGIGQSNARRIAEFADGNARVSLAIAERVEHGESLALLSDTELFSRLFEQTKGADVNLRAQAETLSLVYSFAVSNTENSQNELEVLGSISDCPPNQLFRTVGILLDRDIMQKRGPWRAILPHAIANRLAASALNSYPVDHLRKSFEAPGNERLLMSFAHRLGLLHNHPIAKEIVDIWLQPDGLLDPLLELDDYTARILNYVAPVSPKVLLDRIEAELTANNFEGMELHYNQRRIAITNLLQLLAYEPSTFERCIKLLICLAVQEDPSNNYETARNKVTRFFQPYLSGTHASLEQRIAIMDECLSSDIPEQKSMGFKMLSTALGGPSWSESGIHEFGARPRDFGLHPTYNELVGWRSSFINIAVQMGISGDPSLEAPARLTLAKSFSALWKQETMRDKLIDAAHQLHTHAPWSEGWKAVRSTIFFNHTRRKDKDDYLPLPANLAQLGKELEPYGLIPTIMAYVFSNGRDVRKLDANSNEELLHDKALQLGKNFSASDNQLNELTHKLFSNDYMPYRTSFGKGLAIGAHNLQTYWQQLLDQLTLKSEANKSFEVFAGFIEGVDGIDPVLAQELLDQCALHPALKRVLVGLHPWPKFTEADLDRCMAVLDDPNINYWMYEPVLWKEEYVNLPNDLIFELAQRLLSKPNGDNVILDALSMKLHDKKPDEDTLGLSLRQIGLKAATLRFPKNCRGQSQLIEHHMEQVISNTLRFDGNEAEKQEWLDTIFTVIDQNYGHIHAYEDTITTTAEIMPEAFLNRVFDSNEENRQSRLFCIKQDFGGNSPLTKIDMEALIEWCHTKSDTSIWPSVATGINLWSKDDTHESITILESAIKLLEAAPDPEIILEIFAQRAIRYGDQVSSMQPRVDAIGMLVEHEREDIAKAAKLVSAKLANQIKAEKERERREDEAREQRFE